MAPITPPPTLVAEDHLSGAVGSFLRALYSSILLKMKETNVPKAPATKLIFADLNNSS